MSNDKLMAELESKLESQSGNKCRKKHQQDNEEQHRSGTHQLLLTCSGAAVSEDWLESEITAAVMQFKDVIILVKCRNDSYRPQKQLVSFEDHSRTKGWLSP